MYSNNGDSVDCSLRVSWTERKTKRVVDKIWSGLVLRRRPYCGDGDAEGVGAGEGVD